METLKKRVHSHGLFKQKKNKFITKYIELKLNIFFQKMIIVKYKILLKPNTVPKKTIKSYRHINIKLYNESISNINH